MAGLLGLGVIAYLFTLRPRLLEARQVRNHGLAQYAAALLETHLDAHGQLPDTLRDLKGANAAALSVDAWGNPFHFESRGEAFILVSYGRDGEPDGTNYWKLRDEGSHPPGWRICGDFDRDEVIADVGYLRVCGK